MEANQITWKLYVFDELPPIQLYKMLQLRIEVFVVEQECLYQDLDDKDDYALHLLGYDGDVVVACSRITSPEFYGEYSSIGRVITKQTHRGVGIGKELMKRSIEFCLSLYPMHSIRISAQQYLLRFYNELGFEEYGEVYEEDLLPHMKMIYKNINV